MSNWVKAAVNDPPPIIWIEPRGVGEGKFTQGILITKILPDRNFKKARINRLGCSNKASITPVSAAPFD